MKKLLIPILFLMLLFLGACSQTPSPEITPETMAVQVYFGNSNFNPNAQECNKVYPLDRVVPKTSAEAQTALKELFKGPTAVEKTQGYFSWFSSNTKDVLKSVKVENEIAYVDLVDLRQIIPNASTSCGSAEFLAEMETTLKQFPTIKKVVFAIDKKPTIFYEWLQIGCPPENNACDEMPFKSTTEETKNKDEIGEIVNNCAKIGERPETRNMTTGKPMIPGKPCCSDLKEVFGEAVDDGRICNYSQGSQGICLPCGNNICEREAGEDNCNCPKDCPRLF
ncbi:MAG: GerMN domain-containing protein [Patescibacteria group bacterium]|jgi:hypothetical protein